MAENTQTPAQARPEDATPGQGKLGGGGDAIAGGTGPGTAWSDGPLCGVIVEDHHEVMPFVHAAALTRAEEGRRPMVLVHFDSHPDMCVPECTPYDVKDGVSEVHSALIDRTLLKFTDEISIAEWVLPMAHMGDVEPTLIWFRPPWASQMSIGTQDVILTVDKVTKAYKIHSYDRYYMDEGVAYPRDRLDLESELAVPLKLVVITLPPPSATEDPTEVAARAGAELAEVLDGIDADVYLDVDLDFFSTYNPYRLEFEQVVSSVLPSGGGGGGRGKTKEDYFQLCFDVHMGWPRGTVTNDIELVEVHAKVELFKKEHQALVSERWFDLDLDAFLEKCEAVMTLYEDPEATMDLYREYRDLLRLLDSDEDVVAQYLEDDWMVDVLTLADQPHHISDNVTVARHMEAFQKLCEGYIPRPAYFTISRSCVDEFTPVEMVQGLEDDVLDTYRRLYDADLQFEYGGQATILAGTNNDVIPPPPSFPAGQVAEIGSSDDGEDSG